MDEEEDCYCPPGLPAWMATFSDLMSLLMCFFVLLLSFSEMDALKFKRLAGSLRNAYGVQREIDVNAIPKGTSIIAQNFSPGTPEPTPLNVVRQDTTDDTKDTLDVLCQDYLQSSSDASGDTGQLTRQITIEESALDEAIKAEAAKMAQELAQYVEDGSLQIESINQTIVIRVKEQGFNAGTDFVADDFLPVLDRVRDLLSSADGDIQIEGHTDNLPISGRFRNNWALSSARALAVGEYLWEAPEMPEDRFTIVGHGATKPIASNDTPEGRATNRRVEIVLMKDNPDFQGERVPKDQQGDNVDFGDRSLFGLSPDEIF